MSEPGKPSPAVRAAAVVVGLIGGYDLAVGVFMLVAPEPWWGHGPGTAWAWLDSGMATLGEEARLAQMSALRRLGAFSAYAGLVSVYFAVRFREDRRQLLGFMVLYAVAGLGFALTDAQHFAGTPYYWLKQAIGAVFVVALISLWRSGRKPGSPRG